MPWSCSRKEPLPSPLPTGSHLDPAIATAAASQDSIRPWRYFCNFFSIFPFLCRRALQVQCSQGWRWGCRLSLPKGTCCWSRSLGQQRELPSLKQLAWFALTRALLQGCGSCKLAESHRCSVLGAQPWTVPKAGWSGHPRARVQGRPPSPACLQSCPCSCFLDSKRKNRRVLD